jgi:ABC-type multidrug transport system fused ATPase/permease subunit
MSPEIEFNNLHNCIRDTRKSKKKGVTLLKAVMRCYWKEIAGLGVLSLLITSMTMTAPILTHKIIAYIKQDTSERNTNEGAWLIVGITLIALGKAIFQSHLYYRFAIFGFNLSNTLSLLIFQKSLKYPALCEKNYSKSDIINYSQVDAQRMTSMGVQLTSVLYTPLQIVIGVWLMYTYIGYSFSAGMGTMILIIAFTFFVAKQIAKVNSVTLKCKDARMKTTEEILDIIRFIKTNAI